MAFDQITNLMAGGRPEASQGQLGGGPAIIDNAHPKVDDDQIGPVGIPVPAENNVLDQPDASKRPGAEGIAEIAVLD
ncbi:MAG: hypothetical protein E5V58_03965 [Mesorhizobium sp.]|nr:MAG: hypothetical protein E5V58_03965 [Mesorhizobium sp.]